MDGIQIIGYSPPDSKAGFWPSYCQISTDLDKILQTPILEYTCGPT